MKDKQTFLALNEVSRLKCIKWPQGKKKTAKLLQKEQNTATETLPKTRTLFQNDANLEFYSLQGEYWIAQPSVCPRRK